MTNISEFTLTTGRRRRRALVVRPVKPSFRGVDADYALHRLKVWWAEMLLADP